MEKHYLTGLTIRHVIMSRGRSDRVLKGFKAATRPADSRTPWQWCESHIVVDNTSPMPGRWRSDNSPWVKEPMEVAADSLKNSARNTTSPSRTP